MKAITKCVELIHEAIEKFYDFYNINVEVKLNADEILSIFIYLVAQAKIENIISECEFIKMFSTENAMNSLSGYYLVTLEAAFSHFLMSKEKVLENESIPE